MIISISGTPGTGKTSVAKALAERLGWKLIELNRLAEENRLYAGYDEGRNCRIVDIDRVKKEVEKLVRKNKNLILESHYAHDMLCDIVVMLRINPAELRRRLVAKRWTRRKIEENVQAEIMEVCKTEALEQGRDVLEIDTTGKTPRMAADDIIRKLGKNLRD